MDMHLPLSQPFSCMKIFIYSPLSSLNIRCGSLSRCNLYFCLSLVTYLLWVDLSVLSLQEKFLRADICPYWKLITTIKWIHSPCLWICLIAPTQFFLVSFEEPNVLIFHLFYIFKIFMHLLSSSKFPRSLVYLNVHVTNTF